MTDPKGASSEANTTVKIENAAPWITELTGQSKVLTTKKFSFAAKADDHSKTDRDEGFSWKWAIDNGSYTTGSNPFEATFSGCDKHTVSVTATDQDGAESETNSQSSTVSVKAYEGRFGQPLDEGKYNLVEKSRVVPVKITVGCGSEDLKDLKPAIQLLKGDSSTVSVSGTDEVETYSSSAADTTGVMRAIDSGYIYNLQVPTKYKDGTQVKAGDLLTIRVRPFGDGNQEASMYVVLKVK